MTIPRTKTTSIGIVCPKCSGHTVETIDVLFAHEELDCTHCGATIDIATGATRKNIENVFLACEAADRANG